MAETQVDELPALEYRPLSVDPRGAFSCSVPDIDNWFKRCSKKHKKFSNRVTTVHFEGDDKIVGFYALSIKLEQESALTREDKNNWRSKFNCSDNRFVCLSFDYLAVASKHQRKGIGQLIVIKIIEEFAYIASGCGIEIMTGSAINEDKFMFYERLGFRRYGFSRQCPQMFLPALTAIEMVSAR